MQELLFRFKAAAFHSLASLGLCLFFAGLVIKIWYPDILWQMTGVVPVLQMLFIIDVILGPILTLIIYSRGKLPRHRSRDLLVVVVLQLSAFFYGAYTIYSVRPVYLVFNTGRFDVVFANEFRESDLNESQEYGNLPKWGPKTVGAQLPIDNSERHALTLTALSEGRDLPQVPKYYVGYESVREEVKAVSMPLDLLMQKHTNHRDIIEHAVSQSGLPLNRVKYLIVKVDRRFLTALIDVQTGDIVQMLDITSWP